MIVSSPFHVEVNDKVSNAYSVCYYKSFGSESFFLPLMYLFEPVHACVAVSQPLNFTEGYHIEKVHHWPGLDDGINKAFNAEIMGFFTASVKGEYAFHFWTTNAMVVRVDNEVVTRLGYAGGAITDIVITLNLTAGHHLLDLQRTQYDLFAILRVMWKTPESDWALFDGNSLRFTGRAPSFVQFPTLSTLVGMPVNTTRPIVHAAMVNRFSVEPVLPAKLGMNEATGVVQGSVAAPAFGNYRVTAENEMGSATTTMTVMADAQPLAGLRGFYYRVQDDYDICQNDQDLEMVLDLYAVRDATDFVHPLQPRYGWWEHVPATIFQGQAYIRWEGYLRVDTPGTWVFRVEKTDGLVMLIDGDYAIMSRGCKGEVSSMTTKNELSEGLHPITLLIYTNRNAFALVVEVKKPGETEFHAFSESMLTHLPEEVFSASVSTMQFVQGQAIESIVFRTFGVTLTQPTYSISPNLPQGLTLTPDGTITGTPLETSEWTEYVVSVTDNTHSFNTTVRYSSVVITKPKSVKVVNAKQEEVTAVSLSIYKDMEPLQIQCNEPFCAISITPSLPDGLLLDSSEANVRIIGVPHVVMTPQSFTITASVIGHSVQTVLTIEVPACQFGKYLYVTASGENYTLYLLKNKQIVFQEVGDISKTFSMSLCVPYEDYEIALRPIKKTIGRVYHLKLVREDGLRYLYVDAFENEWYNTTLELVPKTAPTIHMAITSLDLLPGEQIRVAYETTGVFVPIHTKVEQSFLSFDPDKNEMTGSFPQAGIYAMEIVCENDAGSMTVPFTFHVGQCPEGTTVLFAAQEDRGYEDGFNLYEEDTGKLVVHREFTYDRPNHCMLCLEDRPYTAVFFKPSSKPTPYYHPIVFTDEEGEVLAVREINNATISASRFRLVRLFSREDSWRLWFSAKKVAKKWLESDFKDAKWALFDASQNIRFSKDIRVAYLRRQVVLDPNDFFAAIRVRVALEGGVVLYVNGREAVRLNLPQGPITRATPASSVEDLRRGVWVWLDPALFRSGANQLAAEVHITDTLAPETVRLAFSLEHRQLTAHQFAGNVGSIPSSDDPSSTTPEGAFDTNDYTAWESHHLPSTLRLLFPAGERRLCNRLLLRGTSSDVDQPVKFQIVGLLNDTVEVGGKLEARETQDVLKTVNNPFLFPGSFENVLIPFHPARPYQGYGLRVLHTRESAARVSVNYVSFFAEQEVMCPEEKKWPAARGDSISYGKCGFLRLGKLQRRCVVDGWSARWDEEDASACLSRFAGKKEAFLDLGYRIYNCTMEVFERVVAEELRRVLVREMTVKEEDVLFFLPSSCSEDDDYPSVCVDVRLRPHRLTSSYVKMELALFNANATGLFYKKSGEDVPRHIEIQLWKKVVLRERLEGKDIAATITILVLSLAYLIQLYLYCKVSRSLPNSGRKVLKRGNQEMKKRNPKLENLI